jgi:Zn-finger nucleic acid-binding protein
MLTLDLSGNGLFLIERCEKCYGLFFDIGELEKYIQISNVTTSDIDYHLLNSLLNENHHTDYPVQYLKCPVCAQLMNRINYGRKSGVVINKCTSHGIWLDSGQLNHILGWVKSGGFELDRICKEEEREKLLSEHHSEQVFSTYSYANRACEINVSDLVKIVKRFLFG